MENGNVTILPLKEFKPYNNNDGKKSKHYETRPDGTRVKKEEEEEDSPNCEQVQLILPDGTVLLTSFYDTLIFKTSDIEYYAELLRGNDKAIANLTPTFGEPNNSFFNYTILDTKWTFNYAIYNNGLNSQVFDVANWLDFAEGEQVQLAFNDGRGILTSYPNTTLVCTDDPSKVDVIAKAFAGEELGYGKVHRY